MRNSLTKLIYCLCLTFVLNLAVFAQTSEPTQIKWERYAFKKPGFSVVLPKLPIAISENAYERSEESERFGAFSKGVAYVVAYSFEAKDNPYKKFRAVEPFTEKNFAARLAAVRSVFANLKEDASESESLENNWRVTELKSDSTIYRLYFNQENKSWIELQAVRWNDSAADAKRFFDSFKLKKQPQGKEVGAGADHLIPDVAPKVLFAATNAPNALPTPTPAAPVAAPKSNSGSGIGSGSGSGYGSGKTAEPQNAADAAKVKTEAMRLVLKLSPGYTDEARKSNVSGTVCLRITFSASGSVTSVSVISGLPFGLTEKAIAAARKTLFVPAKRNNVAVSISRPVEYAFRIY